MSRSIRGIRHIAAGGVAAALLTVAVAACSSSSSKAAPTAAPASTTTATTLPVAEQAQQLRDYMSATGKGAPLLTWLRETAQLGAGKAPSQAACKALQDRLTQQHLDYQSVQVLMHALPPIVSAKFANVGFDRADALEECMLGKPQLAVVTAANPYNTRLLRSLLKQYGLPNVAL